MSGDTDVTLLIYSGSGDYGNILARGLGGKGRVIGTDRQECLFHVGTLNGVSVY